MATSIVHLAWSPDRVRALRQHLGMTQQAFGEYLGYGQGANVRVYELENGKRQASGPLAVLLSAVAEREDFDDGA